MKNLKSVVITLGAVALTSCSSTSGLPDSWELQITPKADSYVFCESCPAPTKLIHQANKPLEPDEPIIAVKPVIEPKLVTMPVKPYVTKKKVKHKKVTSKPKQCIKWS